MLGSWLSGGADSALTSKLPFQTLLFVFTYVYVCVCISVCAPYVCRCPQKQGEEGTGSLEAGVTDGVTACCGCSELGSSESALNAFRRIHLLGPLCPLKG